MLDMTDLVGVTFWIISAAMVAATYSVERDAPKASGKPHSPLRRWLPVLLRSITSTCEAYG